MLQSLNAWLVRWQPCYVHGNLTNLWVYLWFKKKTLNTAKKKYFFFQDHLTTSRLIVLFCLFKQPLIITNPLRKNYIRPVKGKCTALVMSTDLHSNCWTTMWGRLNATVRESLTHWLTPLKSFKRRHYSVGDAIFKTSYQQCP